MGFPSLPIDLARPGSLGGGPETRILLRISTYSRPGATDNTMVISNRTTSVSSFEISVESILAHGVTTATH